MVKLMGHNLTTEELVWNPYDEGKTIGEIGSENGAIINDEELSNEEARITLEKGGYAPFGITCGIYGLMFHTVFAEDYDEAFGKYEEMKIAIADFFINQDDTDVGDWCGWFSDRF